MRTSTLFDRSRRRIIAAIMAVLVTLFIATLVAIYAFSYAEVYDRNLDELENYAASYQADRMPPEISRLYNQRPRSLDKSPQAAPFYAILFDANGSLVSVEMPLTQGYGVEELVSYAHDVLGKNEKTGIEGPFLFATERAVGYTLVAFMDNTLVSESMGTLFRYTLIVGLFVLIILFFVARWLAGRIVRPVQRAYESQQRFIWDAGHELKTPVAAMEANAELLEREIGDNPWLRNMRYENERLGILVSQLLELSRTEQLETTRERIDFSRVVQAETLASEPLAFERDMNLASKIEPDIQVMGNEQELARLVSILLDNALSHAPINANIELALSNVSNTAVLTVQNPIDAEDVERLLDTDLFERFTRGSEARSDKGDCAAESHYGLGLAIARAIVSAHDGSIEAKVDQAAPSITFTAKIPAA